MKELFQRTAIRSAAVALALCGCEDSTNKAPTERADEAVEAFEAAGLDVGKLAALEKHSLGDVECRRGEISGIETTVCKYPSEQAARAAQPAGLEVVGKSTGAALTSGKLLLVVADRNKADTRGVTINSITKAFLGKADSGEASGDGDQGSAQAAAKPVEAKAEGERDPEPAPAGDQPATDSEQTREKKDESSDESQKPAALSPW